MRESRIKPGIACNKDEQEDVVASPNTAGIGFETITQTSDQNINGILNNQDWDSLNLTYSFPTSSADYGTSQGTGTGQYNQPDPFNGFSALSNQQQTAVLRAFSLLSSYTKLTFTPITETTTVHAALRFANSTKLSSGSTSESWDPNTGVSTSGDVFFDTTGQNPAIGNFDESGAVFHEIGHALGLVHGEQTVSTQNNAFGYMNADKQDIEYSVMNYPSYIGGPLTNDTTGPGSSPQSYMMYDIAALQHLNGANFGNAGQNLTYTWSSTTGQEFINGAGQGVPVTNPSGIGNIFETIWTGGANSTFDLSNFNDAATLDMRPGQFMMFSKNQRADLGYTDKAGGAGPGVKFAQGNVYNALLYNGDKRSEIDNIITGNGDDTVIGNDVFNTITLGSGSDTVRVGSGGARINGGSGSDTFYTSYAASSVDGGGGFNTLNYSWDKDKINVDLRTGKVAKVITSGTTQYPAGTDTFANIQSYVGGAGDDAFVSTGGYYFFNGSGGSNTLDYAWDSAAIYVNLQTDTVSKGWISNLGSTYFQGKDSFSNIQNFVGGSGANVFLSNFGSYTFFGGSATDTLDYSWDKDQITVDIPDGTVAKVVTNSTGQYPGGTDGFYNVESFIGGAGDDNFISAAGFYTFDGGAGANTLDESALSQNLTVDVKSGRVWKFPVLSSGYDTFFNIQTFFGGAGDDLFYSTGGNYSFHGGAGTNELNYSWDQSPITVNVQAGTVAKGTGGSDSFDNVQHFVGGSGNDTFIGVNYGHYKFDGGEGINTLDYSHAAHVIIYLRNDTVSGPYVIKGFLFWSDTFSNIQNFVGTNGNDTIEDGPGTHSFNGGGGADTATFHGARSEYSIETSLGSDGLRHTQVVDHGAAGDGTLDLLNVEHLQFADKTLTSIPPNARDDFNSDATSDILLRNDASGDAGFFQMSNGANTGWHQISGSDTHYSFRCRRGRFRRQRRGGYSLSQQLDG
jgi:serralysin